MFLSFIFLSLLLNGFAKIVLPYLKVSSIGPTARSWHGKIVENFKVIITQIMKDQI